MKCIVFLGLILAGCQAVAAQSEPAARHIEQQFNARGVSGLQLHNGAGDVHIQTHAQPQARLVAEVRGACKVEAAVVGSILQVRVVEPRLGRCTAEVTLQVPFNLAIDSYQGSGNLTIDGAQGALNLHIGSGDVRVQAGAVPRLFAKVGSGDLEVDNVTGPAELWVGSGDARLRYRALPRGQRLAVQVGSGDVEVIVPHGPVVTEVRHGVGDVFNALQAGTGAPLTISGACGSGDLRVRGP